MAVSRIVMSKLMDGKRDGRILNVKEVNEDY